VHAKRRPDQRPWAMCKLILFRKELHDPNPEDVQQLLAFLNKLVKDSCLALLIIHHLRKRSDPQAPSLPMTIDDIWGSSYIPAMARNVLGLQWVATSPNPDENSPRRQ
jgi:hypothetical protein